jgi:hypothetical protein
MRDLSSSDIDFLFLTATAPEANPGLKSETWATHSQVAPVRIRVEVSSLTNDGNPTSAKTGQIPRFPVRSCGKDRVCAFLRGKAHEVQGTHETTQEIADMGHPSFVRGRERVGSELSK